MKILKDRFKEPAVFEAYACRGVKGRTYSCFFSIAKQGEIYFGVESEHPYLSVPNDAGYNTQALTGTNWHDEDDSHWYDFGPVDFADPRQSAQLIVRALEVLATIKPSPLDPRVGLQTLV